MGVRGEKLGNRPFFIGKNLGLAHRRWEGTFVLLTAKPEYKNPKNQAWDLVNQTTHKLGPTPGRKGAGRAPLC